MKTCARLLLVLGAWVITGRLTADTSPETQTVSGTVARSAESKRVMLIASESTETSGR